MKEEFTPLLSAGIHELSLEEIERIGVSDFPKSKRRKEIFDKAKFFLSELLELGVIDEIWADGSFLTEKQEPDDIDLVVFGNAGKLNALTGTARDKAIYLLSDPAQTKIRFMTDMRFAPSESGEWRSYWRGWYCFTRDEKPKGAARLVLEGLAK